MIVGWSVISVMKSEKLFTNDRDNDAGQAVTLNLYQARQNFGCDEELLQEIAGVFIEDVPLIAAELEEARERNDISTVGRLAHSLKGLCATFGAEPARTYAQHIECDAVKNRESDITRERVQTLVHSLEQTITTLRHELRRDV